MRFDGPYKRIPWKYKSKDDEFPDITDVLREILERIEDLERIVYGDD